MSSVDQAPPGLLFDVSATQAAALAVITLLFVYWLVVASSPKSDVGADKSGGLKNEEEKQVAVSTPKASAVLSPVEFRSFEILATTDVSKDTKLIRFKVPLDNNNQERNLGLPIGRHITLQAEVEGTRVMRPYTPTSSPSQVGHFELLIKAYEFGKMSKHIHSLRPGDSMQVRGPIGRFSYHANKYPCIGLIAGGTGITPCLQVMRHILETTGAEGEAEVDRTKFVLFYQNRTFEDILLRADLDGLQRAHPDRVRIVYFLSASLPASRRTEMQHREAVGAGDTKIKAGSGAASGRKSPRSGGKTSPQRVVQGRGEAEEGTVASAIYVQGSEHSSNLIDGYITAELVAQHMNPGPGPGSCPLVCLCGPSGFNASMKGHLLAAGHVDKETIYVW